MSTPVTFAYKLGTSLWFGSQLQDDAGADASGTGVDVSCIAEHKESGEQKTLELVWIDRAQGRFEFWAPGDGTCADWRLGAWACDVQCIRVGAGSGGRNLVLATESINLFIQDRP